MIYNFETATETTTAVTIGDTLLFDFEKKEFVLEDGSPIIVSGKEAVKQFIDNAIYTERGKYPVYSDSFGSGIDNLVGKRTNRDYYAADFYTKLKETIETLDVVEKVSDFTFSGNTISFTVYFTDDSELTESYVI